LAKKWHIKPLDIPLGVFLLPSVTSQLDIILQTPELYVLGTDDGNPKYISIPMKILVFDEGKNETSETITETPILISIYEGDAASAAINYLDEKYSLKCPSLSELLFSRYRPMETAEIACSYAVLKALQFQKVILNEIVSGAPHFVYVNPDGTRTPSDINIKPTKREILEAQYLIEIVEYFIL
jgi:hypothetical protein